MAFDFMSNVKKIWCSQPQARSFFNLAELTIHYYDSLEYVFSPFMATYLVNLHTLSLSGCPSLKQIVDGTLETGSFVKLKILNVSSCRQLRNIFLLPTEIDTVHLEKLEIGNCESMKEVIKWEGREEDATNKLQFLDLRELTIKG